MNEKLQSPTNDIKKKIQHIPGEVDFYPKSGLVGDYSQHFLKAISCIKGNIRRGLSPLDGVTPIPLYRGYFKDSTGVPPVNEGNLKNVEAIEDLATQANEIIEASDTNRVNELLGIIRSMEDLMRNGPVDN